MRFEAPWALLILLIIPLVVWLHYRSRGQGSIKFSSISRAQKIGKSLRQRLIELPLFLRVLTLIVLAVAIARPQEGKERVREVSKGIAIEMVVDRSGSMQAEMEYEGRNYNRLEVVKKVFEEFITGQGRGLEGRPNDLIGMISFARFADTICPLTLAHGALSEFLKSVKLVTQRNEDGTAIGDAVALAAARLKTAEETLARQTRKDVTDFEIKSKIIILLTDGQNNSGERNPLEAAALAKKWDIKIYTIGVGGREGLVRRLNPFGSFLTRLGEGVDQKTLQKMAEETGGLFRMAEDADALRAIYREIDQLERSEVESIRFLDYRELFTPFALLAAGLLITEVILAGTVFRKIP
jgi:Ca-activated chloride channel homolog